MRPPDALGQLGFTLLAGGLTWARRQLWEEAAEEAETQAPQMIVSERWLARAGTEETRVFSTTQAGTCEKCGICIMAVPYLIEQAREEIGKSQRRDAIRRRLQDYSR